MQKLYAEHDAKKKEIEDGADAELKWYMDAPTSDEDEWGSCFSLMLFPLIYELLYCLVVTFP